MTKGPQKMNETQPGAAGATIAKTQPNLPGSKVGEDLEIVWVPIGDVKPYALNPRDNGKAVAGVVSSLQEFGWQQPIVVDVENVIIVGHTRYAAALQLGLTLVPVTIAYGLTDDQVKAYRIADNRVGELADWDLNVLGLELRSLKDHDYDLELTGFDGVDLKRFETAATRKQGDEYGGATALGRTSAPMRHWKKAGLILEPVLNFGAGDELEPGQAVYDMITSPDPAVLLSQYRTVIVNYVLNVQPSDHLIDLILALVHQLLADDDRIPFVGQALIAVVAEKRLSGSAACGGRDYKTGKEWKEILERFFEVDRVKANFTGFVCRRRP